MCVCVSEALAGSPPMRDCQTHAGEGKTGAAPSGQRSGACAVVSVPRSVFRVGSSSHVVVHARVRSPPQHLGCRASRLGAQGSQACETRRARCAETHKCRNARHRRTELRFRGCGEGGTVNTASELSINYSPVCPRANSEIAQTPTPLDTALAEPNACSHAQPINAGTRTAASAEINCPAAQASPMQYPPPTFRHKRRAHAITTANYRSTASDTMTDFGEARGADVLSRLATCGA